MTRTWITGSLCLLGTLALGGTARAEGYYGEPLQPGVTVVPDPAGKGQIVCVPNTREPVSGKENKDCELDRQKVAGFEEVCARETNVHFAFDSAKLSNDAQNILAGKAKCFTADPSKHATIVGATDPTGSSEYNEKLGERRAQAVSSYLTEHGVGKDQLDIKSVGKDEQLCSDKSEDCWSRNRRAGVIPSGAGGAGGGREPTTPED
jgi:outer membrane protein OmpA-like peptidoglycan-associated protein